jgi:hypothetical protein
MAQQKISIPIPPDLKPAQRTELADLVIEHIVERTQNNKDKDGRKFPPYSKSYIKSLDFANAGKSKSDVNLTLSGDMLAALKLLNQKNSEITIGFDRGADENARAEGNILGSYGGEPNKKKARDFLGIEEKKLRQLIKYVKENNG